MSPVVFERVMWAIGAALLITTVILLFSMFQKYSYMNGYCAGLGGERISGSEFCNVDGRVVEIPYAE